MSLRKVSPGEEINLRASDWNEIIDAVRAVQGMIISDRPRPRAAPSPQGATILAQNNETTICPCFGILGISTTLFDPATKLRSFQNTPAVAGVKPTAAAHTGRFIIATEPIPPGKIGFCLTVGVCPVQIDVTDEDHEFADVADGDWTKLASGASGLASILYKPSGTGTKWAIVRIGGASQAPEAEAGVSFAVRVSQDGGDAGDENSACTYTYTVEDLDGNILNKTRGGTSAPEWITGTTYALDVQVVYSDKLYTSLQAANQGHTPSSSPTWWHDDGTGPATKMTPVKLRPTAGLMRCYDEDGYGLSFYGANDQLVLWDAGEVADQAECT
jgi:hypothetical protein